MGRFGVQYSPLSQSIWAGLIGAGGRHFVDKSEVTMQVISALEDKVLKDHGGAAEFTRRDEHGKTVVVSVEVRVEEKEVEDE